MKPGKMRLGYNFLRLLVLGWAKLYLGMKVFGQDNIPREGRIIIVANHISEYDPPAVGSCIPRETCYAAKAGLFKGFVGRLIRYVNGIPVRRRGSDKEAIKAMINGLQEDKAVLIFPEGTRSLDPNGLDPKAGVGMIAVMAESDLLPVRVAGTREVPKSIFRPGHVTVQFGKRISLADLAKGSANRKETYQKIADEIMRQVRRLAEESPSNESV
ncbi:MAG: lysophospholipid acyltransferase family protein [bacterium]